MSSGSQPRPRASLAPPLGPSRRLRPPTGDDDVTVAPRALTPPPVTPLILTPLTPPPVTPR
jgi:hypothetical protein